MSTSETQTPDAAHTPELDLTPVSLGIKKILVPTDFSPDSYKALRHALDLARQFASDVNLLHVVEPIYPYPVGGISGYPVDLPPDPIFESRSEALKLLDSLRKEVEERSSIPLNTSLRVGRAYDQIVEAAREMKADMIVIPTHGYTGLKHVLLGSTAEKVVRHAPCPVLVIRASEYETT